MMRYLLILIILFAVKKNFAQEDSLNRIQANTRQNPETTRTKKQPAITTSPKDTTVISDSLTSASDSVIILTAPIFLPDSLFTNLRDSQQHTLYGQKGYEHFFKHPLIQYKQTPIFFLDHQRVYNDQDFLFYLLTGIFALMAILKVLFPKYFQQIFALFFQPTFRQKQTQDTLLQNNLASLLYNGLFIFTGGTYIALLFIRNAWAVGGFWNIFAYASVILALIYTGKYVFLKLAGWLFNEEGLAASYMFTVFLIHKVTAILLLPFLWLLAFSTASIVETAYITSIFIIVTLFFYRYVVAFGGLRNVLKINLLHFFLYFCAVEIIPLLVIYKLLANYLNLTI